MKRFLATVLQASIEIAPSSVDTVLARADAPRRVFVNMIETDASHFDAVISAVRRLASSGFEAVPHVPASMLRDEAHATRILEALADAGARSALVLGGNVQQTKLDATRLADLAEPLFHSLLFPAFPDGHPRADDRLDDKLERFPGSSVVTQWSPNPVDAFLDDFCPRHRDVEVHVGVVGPAKSQAALLKFARFCGVDIDPAVDPQAFVDTSVRNLDAYAERHPDARLRLHVFPLGTTRSLDYLRQRQAGDHSS